MSVTARRLAYLSRVLPASVALIATGSRTQLIEKNGIRVRTFSSRNLHVNDLKGQIAMQDMRGTLADILGRVSDFLVRL